MEPCSLNLNTDHIQIVHDLAASTDAHCDLQDDLHVVVAADVPVEGNLMFIDKCFHILKGVAALVQPGVEHRFLMPIIPVGLIEVD